MVFFFLNDAAPTDVNTTSRVGGVGCLKEPGPRLSAVALYDPRGEFAYGGSGFNWRAVLALACLL